MTCQTCKWSPRHNQTSSGRSCRPALPSLALIDCRSRPHGPSSPARPSASRISGRTGIPSILETSTPFPQGEPPADAALALPLNVYTGAYSDTVHGEVTVREENGALVLKFGPNGVQHRPWRRDAHSGQRGVRQQRSRLHRHCRSQRHLPGRLRVTERRACGEVVTASRPSPSLAPLSSLPSRGQASDVGDAVEHQLVRAFPRQ